MNLFGVCFLVRESSASFMFPGTEGEPLELAVMSDVPACADGAAIGVEQVGFPDAGSGFELLDS
jgi:hypothetical protein